MSAAELERRVVVRVARWGDFRELLPGMEAALSPDDRRRAERYRREEDRFRFVLGRGLLRRLLEEYGSSDEEPFGLEMTKRGRPVLKNRPGMEFSVSHSHELVGLGLTLKSRVGVDIEAISRQIQLSGLAERILSPHELQHFQALSPNDQPGIFFKAWTAKEAFLKATGVGLAGGLTEIEIPLGESGPETFQPEGIGGPAWNWQRLPLPEGYAGCVVWDDPAKVVDFGIVSPSDFT